MEIALLKIIAPTAITFMVGLLVTPFITHWLYKNEMWKKKAGKGTGYGGGATPIFDKLHKEKDTNTPRMGGVVIWLSVFITTVLMWAVSLFGYEQLSFLSRSQTWLPMLALAVGALVGFLDDYLVVSGGGNHFAGGLPLSQRILVVGATALFTAWWFYEKLGVSSVSFFTHEIEMGMVFIPFFIIFAIAVYSSSVIDGIDGLSGGVFMFIFSAYTAIAFYQNQIDIAALCAAIVGGILAFLWFNIPPARFYTTETGVMALTMTLTVITFMTDTLADGKGVSVFPVVGFLLVITVISNVIQVGSKKIRGKKVFLVAPIHHHFEAIGWPSYKVTMRYWVLGFICAIVGFLLAIVL